LRNFFPKQCAAVDERRFRGTVRHGIQGAARCRITLGRGVCKHIDPTNVFGRDSHSDKRNRWAREILKRRGKPEAKMESLLRAAKLRLGNG
jgi:hypothetical protein